MKTLVLMSRELWHSRSNTLLTLAGLSLAVGLLVAVQMTSTAAERETRRVMRDLGFNLRIVPRDTDMDHFWAHGHSDQTMPESAVQKLAAKHGVFLTFNHLTPTLEKRFRVGDRDALLTGLGPAIVGPGEGKQPMGFQIPQGRVTIGHAIAQRLELKRTDTLTLGDREFVVDRVLAESGSEDDIRIFASLADAQDILGLPNQINEIKAIDCLCLTGEDDPLSQLRAVIEDALPEARVFQLRSLADARARQRQMAERYARFAVPLVLGVTAGWVGLLSAWNVRERRVEIGLWRALGYPGNRITGLFLARHLCLGLVAAIFGHGFGTWLALKYGPAIFQVTARNLQFEPPLLALALVATPLFAVVASLIPITRAIARDPADTLRAD